MAEFPIKPFLEELVAEGFVITIRDYQRLSMVLSGGGTWSMTRLRNVLTVLLARNPQQQDALQSRFNQFFTPEIDREASALEFDLAGVLADLRSLSPPAKPDPPEKKEEPPDPARPPGKEADSPPRKISHWWRWVVALLSILSLGLGLWVFWILYQTADVPPVPIPDFVWPMPAEPPSRQVSSKLDAVKGKLDSLRGEVNYRDALVIVPLLWLPIFLLWLYSRAEKKHAEKQDAPRDGTLWDQDKARHFSHRSIGGTPAPRLSPKLLDELAEILGYFQDDTGRKHLDAHASALATVRKGGLPTLLYRERRTLRKLYLLEDTLAAARSWNTLVREMVEGLRARGINVVHGNFRGVPTRFRTFDGGTHWLQDLEEERDQHVLLLFSDSQHLQQTDQLWLRQLSQWSQCAWMELREPRSWDHRTALVARARLPVFPATAAGLLRAFRRFAADADRAAADSPHLQWRGVQPRGRAALPVYVEYLLGDALRWAQACAMLQPVTLGLADALRVKFMPHLPPERLERLLLLPDTQQSVAGLKFSDEVLAILRAGFVVRWNESQQKEVLQFIIEQIRAVEPEKGGLAHLAWEWTLERVRLELSPDEAINRLHALAQSPLGAAIRADLENVFLPTTHPDGAAAARPLIPLRRWPESPEALHRLAGLAELITAPEIEIRPARLKFHQLKGGGSYVKQLKIYNRGGAIEGRIGTEEAWLKCDPEEFTIGLISPPAPGFLDKWRHAVEVKAEEARRRFSGSIHTSQLSTVNEVEAEETGRRAFWTLRTTPQRVAVKVETAGLALGAHKGLVKVETAGGDCVARVDIYIRRSLGEAAGFWFERIRNYLALQVMPPLIFACVGAFLLLLYLPPNWLNGFYNQPPLLIGIDANLTEYGNTSESAQGQSPPDGGSSRLLDRVAGVDLTAVAYDPDGVRLQYEWSINDKPIAGNSSEEISVQPDSENLKVTLKVRDPDGGRASYQQSFVIRETLVPVVEEPSEPKPGPTASPQPTKQPTKIDPPVRGNSSLVMGEPPSPPDRSGLLIESFTVENISSPKNPLVRICWKIAPRVNSITISTTVAGSRGPIFQGAVRPVACEVYGGSAEPVGYVLSVESGGEVAEMAVDVPVDGSRCQSASRSLDYPYRGHSITLQTELNCLPDQSYSGKITFRMFAGNTEKLSFEWNGETVKNVPAFSRLLQNGVNRRELYKVVDEALARLAEKDKEILSRYPNQTMAEVNREELIAEYSKVSAALRPRLFALFGDAIDTNVPAARR